MTKSYYSRIDAIEGNKGYAEYSASVGEGQYGQEPITAKFNIAVKHNVENSDIGAGVFCFDINLSVESRYLPVFTDSKIFYDSDLFLCIKDVIDDVATSYKTKYNDITFNIVSENTIEQKILDRIKPYLLHGQWAETSVSYVDKEGNRVVDSSRLSYIDCLSF